MAPESFRFDSDDIQLSGDRWGGADLGETVVLLHGGGQTRHS